MDLYQLMDDKEFPRIHKIIHHILILEKIIYI